MSELEAVTIAAGAPGRPTLVFLHEGLGSVALWKDFPSALAARTGCDALIYSRHGNGFSPVLSEPRDSSYMHDEALRALPEVLERYEIERPILIGHSDGASIALIYAGTYPENLRAIVVEAPHVFVEECSTQSIAAIRREYETTSLRDRMARYHADADRTFYGWNDVWLSPEFANWNIESHLERIRVPILAIQGTEDQYGTIAQIETIARRAPVGVDRLMLARCGHAPHLDRRDIVEAAIAGWLSI